MIDRTGASRSRGRRPSTRRRSSADDDRTPIGADIERAGRRGPAGHAAADGARAPARAAPAGERARRAAWRRPTRRDPEAAAARERLRRRSSPTIGRAAAMAADEARAAGPRPADLPDRSRSTTGAGANLLQVAPLPPTFSYSSLRHVRALPAPVRVPVRLPDARSRDEPVAGVQRSGRRPTRRSRRSPGSAASALARGEPPPTREDLERRSGRAGRRPASATRRPRRATSGASRPCSTTSGTARSQPVGEALARGARLRADARPRRRQRRPSSSPARSTASTGCRRAASRSSTTRPAASRRQKGVDESLQLSIYALACRDALGLGTPERVTLYFTESATAAVARRGRTSSWTRPATDDPGAGVADARRRVRGDAAARPCQWCDYRAMCPERV